MNESLTLWGNGAVTLPKEWREKYGTKHFIARENERGYLVIMPVVESEYYEEADGSFGLRFPMGVEPGELAQQWEAAMTKATPGRKRKRKIATRRRSQ